MPVHDWAGVGINSVHDFHLAFVTHLSAHLNNGVLPSDIYSTIEAREAASTLPDVAPNGIVATENPPSVARVAKADETFFYRRKQRRVAIRHAGGHQVIAFIEIASPANKDRAVTVETFVREAVEGINAGVHLLMVDLFPPGPHDPGGLHRAIWDHYGEEYVPPADKPLIAVAYQAGLFPTAYLEPLAVGDGLPTMPLFLTPERYINVPLAPSYEAAWHGVPQVWRDVVEGRAEG